MVSYAILKRIQGDKMKKIISLSIIMFLLFLTGCSKIDLPIMNKKKPYNFYYTNELAKNIHDEPIYSCTILDTNLYKEKALSQKELPVLSSFFKELKKSSFMNSKPAVQAKPEYRMFITFKNAKFVVNVYNSRYISIFPWDGDYKEDYIDMNNISAAFNLYNLCRFKILSHE